jgi:subtilisin family serine protease
VIFPGRVSQSLSLWCADRFLKEQFPILKKSSTIILRKMKPPILGKQTFLHDHPVSGSSFDTFNKERNEGDDNPYPLYTGRYLLIMKERSGSLLKMTRMLESKWGFKVASSSDFVRETLDERKIKSADALFYNELGIALLGADEEIIERLSAPDAEYLIEPEKVVYIPDDIAGEGEQDATWGIHITGALQSPFSGLGVRVAIIDTGYDPTHPDFTGREITGHSFVPEETVEDLHGHGTHCLGIACGETDNNSTRYGIATAAQIYVAKVLNKQGSGAQAWVLDGMTGAVNNGCRVLSMSLGSPVYPGQEYDMAYERAAQYALSRGAVVVAAAGNDSRRSQNRYSPVSSPADCPSILAVGALDESLAVADFSNRAVNKGGEVDIAAPGVAIYSSWPMPTRYRTLSGTSMATPHVAGIIALLWEKYPEATAAMITEKLRDLAKTLPLPPEDIGAGLSFAPMKEQ